MEPIKNLFNKVKIIRRPRTKTPGTPRSEREELSDQILARLNPSRIQKKYAPITHKRLGYILQGLEVSDLHALISKCNDAERRGYPWSAIFWKEITPPKKTP